MRLDVPDDELTSVVGCLALGLLHAIRAGAVAPEAGIWTLGRPGAWEPLQRRAAIPPDLLDVLQTCDELSALRQLAPDRFDAEVGTLVGRVEAVLAGDADHAWQVRWESDDAGAVGRAEPAPDGGAGALALLRCVAGR